MGSNSGKVPRSKDWWAAAAIWIIAVGIAVPFNAALHPEEVNAFSVLAVPLYGAILIALAHDGLRPYVIPLGIVAVPGPINHFAPMVAIGPPDEIGATLVPVLNHIDGILLVLTVVALSRPRTRSTPIVRVVQFALMTYAAAAVVSRTKLGHDYAKLSRCPDCGRKAACAECLRCVELCVGPGCRGVCKAGLRKRPRGVPIQLPFHLLEMP